PDGRILVRELRCGSSYLTSEDHRFHLGLGASSQVRQLVITLPDGQRSEFSNVPANQILEVEL
ncbi:MAG: CRTAC1 family protein, partial [Deltaproteobacteria bacterium]|nr:CRTAC1 family protein [Deltaproteobacteria bacterium]